MRSILFIVFCLVYVTHVAELKACDVCGAGLSNSDLGILTNSRNDFLRLGMTSMAFSSGPEHESTIADRFSSIELIGRFSLSDRLRLTCNIPYAFNKRTYADEQLSVQGLADVKINLGYVILDKELRESKFYIDFIGGFNLPTGRYDEDLHAQNLPENFNLGKGNVGVITQVNGVWSKNNYGLAISNRYQMNTNTNSGYHFGNPYNTNVTGYKRIKIKEAGFIPSLSLSYENIAKDTYSNKNQVPGTGGNGLFAGIGVNYQKNKFLISINTSLPVSENYSDGEVGAQSRISIQLSYIF